MNMLNLSDISENTEKGQVAKLLTKVSSLGFFQTFDFAGFLPIARKLAGLLI